MGLEDEASVQAARSSMELHINGRRCREGYIALAGQQQVIGGIAVPLPAEFQAVGVVVGPDHAEALKEKLNQRVSVLYEGIAYWATVVGVETGSDLNRIQLAIEPPEMEEEPPSPLDELSNVIVGISKWISGSYPPDLDPEAHDHRRLMKYQEERGEVRDAYGDYIGENPRKGSTKSRADVLKELFDLAGSALGAASYWSGETGDVMEEFRKHMWRVGLRNGTVRNQFLPPKPEDEKHSWSDGPTDIGGNHRCTFCGAYRGSVEGERKCQGEFKESGKMRVWARDKWEAWLAG